MTWQKTLQAPGDLDAAFTVPAHFASGFAIGVIAVDLRYPKLPGNVANATTFAFPVLYERVDFPIEQLFAGDPAIKDQVVGAARRLEAQGCGRSWALAGSSHIFRTTWPKPCRCPSSFRACCNCR